MTFDVAKSLLNSNSSRKKRRYALLLFSAREGGGQRDVRTIEKVFASALPDMTLLRLEDPDEGLKVLLLKNIELIIIDDTFFGDDVMAVEYAVEAKKRKKCPIVFVTSNERRLIEEYRKQMALYEELDDYLSTPVDFIELSRRLKRVAAEDGRAAKRFNVDEKLAMYRLDTGTHMTGTLTDMSLVGFGLTLDHDVVFRRHEQIQVSVPLMSFSIFHPQYGDFLRLSGKVRRISIDGKNIGCSIEYITPMQNDCLVRLIEQVAKRLRLQRANATKKTNVEAGT